MHSSEIDFIYSNLLHVSATRGRLQGGDTKDIKIKIWFNYGLDRTSPRYKMKVTERYSFKYRRWYYKCLLLSGWYTQILRVVM